MTRSWVRLAGACALGLALLAWLTRGVDWSRIFGAVHPTPWWTWAATVFGLGASYLFRALRIRAELSTRLTIGLQPCLELMLVHNAAVNVLPMRGGEAAYPWLLHRRLGVPVSHAVASLVWMRVQDLIVLASLAATLWPGIPPFVRVVAAAGLAAAVLGGLHLLERAAVAKTRPRRGAIRAAQTSLQALALAPRHGWRGWAFCIASWTVKLLALGSLLAALAGLGPVEGWTGALGGELAGVLPVQGPAGLGTYEAGVWAGAAMRGRSAVDIAAPALVVHLVAFATAVLAGAIAHAAALGRTFSSPAFARPFPSSDGARRASPRGALSASEQPSGRLEHDDG